MVKKGKNVLCTVCGKRYRNPISAQEHIRKHPNASAQQTIVVITPPPGTGSKRLAIYERTISAATALGIPQVAKPPTIQPREGNNLKPCKYCSDVFVTNSELKNHLRSHTVFYKCTACSVEFTYRGLWNHTNKAHGIPFKAMKRSVKKRVTNDKRKTAPAPSESSSDYEGQLPSEGEEDLSSDDEGDLSFGDKQQLSLEDGGQPSSEVEQRSPLEGEGRQPAQGNRQYIGCDLCPDAFLTVETLAMHAKFVHCWRCGYCRDLPPFPSISLWREHRVRVHGLDGWKLQEVPE